MTSDCFLRILRLVGVRRHPMQIMIPLNVPARSAPIRNDSRERDRGGVVAGELVIAGGDAAEILQAAGLGRDAPALPVSVLSWRTSRLRARVPGITGVMPSPVGRRAATPRRSPGLRSSGGRVDPISDRAIRREADEMPDIVQPLRVPEHGGILVLPYRRCLVILRRTALQWHDAARSLRCPRHLAIRPRMAEDPRFLPAPIPT